MRRNNYTLIVMIGIFALLSGCQLIQDKKNQTVLMHASNKIAEENLLQKTLGKSDQLLPLAVDDHIFQTVVSWLNNEEIIYIENQDNGSKAISYHLFTGEKKILYESDFPILSVLISPLKSYMLVQSSLSTYQAQIDIVDINNRQIIFSQDYEAKELTADWNVYNEKELLLTVFHEDWTYDTYLLQIDRKENKKIDFPQPFAKWLANDKWLMIDWDLDSPNTIAPLIVWEKGKKERIFREKQFYHLNGWKGMYLGISVHVDDIQKGEFSFFDQNFKMIYSFSIPHLSKYSEWLVPYYDYNSDRNLFFLIEPLRSGEADMYTGGFQLVQRDIEQKTKTVIIKNIENMPIQCSPNGNLCLYGYRYENIIFMKEKKIMPLIVATEEQ